MAKIYSKKTIPENLLLAMRLNLQINAKTQELSRWREISEKAAGIIYSHAQSDKRNGSRIEDCLVKIEAIELSIKNDLDNLVQLQVLLSDIIGKISDSTCQTLLRLRYLCGMGWDEVAEVMDYSYLHVVHRLHPKALEKFNGVI